MKKIGQIALLASRKRQGSTTSSSGPKDGGSEREVDDTRRVAYTSTPPVDLSLGEYTLKFRNGEWQSSNLKPTLQPMAEAATASGAETEKLKRENEALRGEVNMLKFKMELLIDMVTLANLDCDKLEEELNNVKA